MCAQNGEACIAYAGFDERREERGEAGGGEARREQRDGHEVSEVGEGEAREVRRG
jgi:hypothetical protein